MINVEWLMQQYIYFDKPIPYESLFIYPIKIEDYYDFVCCIDIFMIDKNILGQVEFIQMPYLQFLFDVVFNQDKTQESKFVRLFELCLGVDLSKEELKIGKDEKGKIFLTVKDIKISSKQFEDIKRIILYQNINEYDDKYVDPDLKKARDEYLNFVNRGIDSPSIENQIAIITSHTGICKKDLMQYTYRSFDILFNTVKEEVDYTISKSAEMSGNVTFKQPIEHWIYKTKKDKYADAFVNKSAFDDKMKNVT